MKDIGRYGKDKITGFEGTIVGFCAYISGCNQLLLSPSVDEKGTSRDPHWFDVQRVEVSGKAIVLENAATPGPDKAAPIR